MKSNYKVTGKISNYYQFFLCLHLKIQKDKNKIHLDKDKINQKKKRKKKTDMKKAEYKNR